MVCSGLTSLHRDPADINSGHAIAVAWSDDCIDVVTSSHGNLIRQIRRQFPPISNDGNAPLISGSLSYMGWNRFIIEPQKIQADLYDGSARSKLMRSNPIQSFSPSLRSSDSWNHIERVSDTLREGITAYVPDEEFINVAVDLPRQLALIDVEDQMPKLSSLPHVDDKAALNFQTDFFTSQTNVDSVCAPFTEEEVYRNTVDGLFAFWLNGSSTTVLGEIESDSGPTGRLDMNISKYASHPRSQTIAAVMQSSHGNQDDRSIGSKVLSNVSLQFTNLNAVQKSGQYLLFVSKKTNELRRLAQYVSQSVVSIRSAWIAGQEAPSRFIDRIRESLSEGSFVDIDAALYHQAVTGDALKPVRDWLTETIHDRVRFNSVGQTFDLPGVDFKTGSQTLGPIPHNQLPENHRACPRDPSTRT